MRLTYFSVQTSRKWSLPFDQEVRRRQLMIVSVPMWSDNYLQMSLFLEWSLHFHLTFPEVITLEGWRSWWPVHVIQNSIRLKLCVNLNVNWNLTNLWWWPNKISSLWIKVCLFQFLNQQISLLTIEKKSTKYYNN